MVLSDGRAVKTYFVLDGTNVNVIYTENSEIDSSTFVGTWTYTADWGHTISATKTSTESRYNRFRFSGFNDTSIKTLYDKLWLSVTLSGSITDHAGNTGYNLSIEPKEFTVRASS